MADKIKPIWSKSYNIRPRPNIVSHELINQKKFVPSYDKNCTPTTMKNLLDWEYGRTWLIDRCEYLKKIEKGKTKQFSNTASDYESWLKKREPKAKKTVQTVPKRARTNTTKK